MCVRACVCVCVYVFVDGCVYACLCLPCGWSIIRQCLPLQLSETFFGSDLGKDITLLDFLKKLAIIKLCDTHSTNVARIVGGAHLFSEIIHRNLTIAIQLSKLVQAVF